MHVVDVQLAGDISCRIEGTSPCALLLMTICLGRSARNLTLRSAHGGHTGYTSNIFILYLYYEYQYDIRISSIY